MVAGISQCIYIYRDIDIDIYTYIYNYIHTYICIYTYIFNEHTFSTDTIVCVDKIATCEVSRLCMSDIGSFFLFP